jgi:hypothetical protein
MTSTLNSILDVVLFFLLFLISWVPVLGGARAVIAFQEDRLGEAFVKFFASVLFVVLLVTLSALWVRYNLTFFTILTWIAK